MVLEKILEKIKQLRVGVYAGQSIEETDKHLEELQKMVEAQISGTKSLKRNMRCSKCHKNLTDSEIRINSKNNLKKLICCSCFNKTTRL